VPELYYYMRVTCNLVGLSIQDYFVQICEYHFIHQITSEQQRCSDVAFIDRSKEYCPTADKGHVSHSF